MTFLQFPVVNRAAAASEAWRIVPALVHLALCTLLALASCGPPTWQGGIHAHLAWSPEGVRVVEVPPESPAERAGLRTDDRILSVDGKEVTGLPIEKVAKLLSGEVGSTARLLVLRDGDRVTLEVARAPYVRKGDRP